MIVIHPKESLPAETKERRIQFVLGVEMAFMSEKMQTPATI
jgi:hypothetical protein